MTPICQLYHNPQVVAARVVGTCHLDKGLDNRCRLEIGSDHVVLLIGS